MDHAELVGVLNARAAWTINSAAARKQVEDRGSRSEELGVTIPVRASAVESIEVVGFPTATAGRAPSLALHAARQASGDSSRSSWMISARDCPSINCMA